MVCQYCFREFKNKRALSSHLVSCKNNPFRSRGRQYSLLESELDDDGKLYSKWLNKRNNAKKEGILCLLTFDEYCHLIKEANLKSSDLGFSGNNYVLARYNDLGDYTYSNCRFITQIDNAKEKIITDKSRTSSSNNIQKFNHNRNDYYTKNPDKLIELKNKISEGVRNSEYYKQLELKRQLLDLNKNPSYSGERNSQFGSYWITDGISNKKWKDIKGVIPDGFYRGRTLLKKTI